MSHSLIENPLQKQPEKIPKTTTDLSRLQIELDKAQTPEQKRHIREEILSIRRSIHRAEQYNNISQTKLAEGKNTLDTISVIELLKIDKEVSKERRGEFLAKSFLYKRTTDIDGTISEESTSGKDLSEGDTLYVDFGGNQNANNRIGLGQMLGTDIGYIKVNGKIGIRSIINNRVGYYTENSAKGYIPVFTGDTVIIPTASEVAIFISNPTINGIIRNTEQKDADIANDNYINRLKITSIDTVEINTNINESYNFWKSKGFTHEQASGIIANEYRESKGNPRGVGDSGKAIGIFQWHPDRREAIKNSTQIDIEKATHYQQLEAAYWEITQGGESKVLQPLKNTKTAGEAGAIFSKIYERPMNEEGEMAMRGEMAEAFAMLMDTEGRSMNLGDYISQIGPANLGENSCGAAVRKLLQSYGITSLPESGANGKDWENILNDRPSQFIKMKISHPDQAYPGAILVYNGSGSKGSEMNKEFGHVEIKGSDGKYYSYYESQMAAGSAKSSSKDIEQYQQETGFIGYAYYPKQGKSI